VFGVGDDMLNKLGSNFHGKYDTFQCHVTFPQNVSVKSCKIKEEISSDV